MKNKEKTKKILGLIEPIYIDNHKYMAKVDTGADRSSICDSLIPKINMGSPLRAVKTKSALGQSSRLVFDKEVVFGGKKIKSSFSVTSRKSMKYKILIGKNILKKGFLIDPSK